MTLMWQDQQEIGEALNDEYPDLDPLSISFVKLRELIVSLADFEDDPEKSSEQILERILQAWLDERN